MYSLSIIIYNLFNYSYIFKYISQSVVCPPKKYDTKYLVREIYYIFIWKKKLLGLL